MWKSRNAVLLLGVTVCCFIALTKFVVAADNDGPKRRPVPTDADLDKARELARSVYGDRVKAATDNEAKERLAEILLRDAGDNVDDPPAYYSVLQLARNLAILAQNARLAMEAIQAIDDTFEVNGTAMRLEALEKIASADSNGKRHRIIAAYYYRLAQDAASQGKAGEFRLMIDSAIDIAHLANDKSLEAQLQARKELIKQGIIYEGYRTRLLTEPTDPLANYIVGKHKCLVDRDWDTGLGMLTRASDPKWKEIAELELSPPTTPEEVLKVAGGWYDLANASPEGDRPAVLRHAAEWYRKVLPELKGLRHAAEKDLVEKRLTEANKLPESVSKQPALGPILEGDSAFSWRSPENRELLILWNRSAGLTPQSERAVAAALNWLARHQMPDGNWSLKEYPRRCKDKTCSGPGQQESLSAATAMGLLPFLAAGQSHVGAGPYQKAVNSGIYWLLKNQKKDGDLSAGAELQMYAQGLAAIALCEDYGISHDKSVGAAAQSAINFIQSAQNSKTAGWRYHPGEEGDTSVLGWQFAALRAGQLAGLRVNPGSLEGVRRWLKFVSKRPGNDRSGETAGGFSYQPDTEVTPSMSAVGLLCSQYLQVERQSPGLARGVEYLMANPPDEQNARNIYYWYYATQVLHNLADDDWEAWNRKMQAILVRTQAREGCATGSWDPDRPVRDAWGPQGGRVMMTSLSALILEVYYRYPPVYVSETAVTNPPRLTDDRTLLTDARKARDRSGPPAPAHNPETKAEASEQTAAFIQEWTAQFREAYSNALAKETSDAREEEKKKVNKSFHDKISGKTLAFRFPINDISGSAPNYILQLDAPTAAKGDSGIHSLVFQFSLRLNADQAKRVKKGDYLILHGVAELATDDREINRLESMHYRRVIGPSGYKEPGIQSPKWILFLDRSSSYRIDSQQPGDTSN
jgi:hypothetical protein